MKLARFLIVAMFAVNTGAADWRRAEPGWQYEFPRDHHAHDDFKTEWWYFTGNLLSTKGDRFGYELTFFREGVRPPDVRDPNDSRFIVNDLKFAHFALSDISKGRFHFEQKMSRGAFGEAGFDDKERLAWIENWTLALTEGDTLDLTAQGKAGEVHLHLRPVRPPVVHGENGISIKATEIGHASHYYSVPRFETTGELLVDGESYSIHGQSWFDHEWATSQLGEGQAGWDWMCVQWDDGTELMLYQMRRISGESDPSSSGTWIGRNGKTVHLRSSDFQMAPITFWKSKTDGVRYPVGWRVTLPEQRMEFVVQAALDNQELVLGPITYWEGAIDANGTQSERPITGHGYLELTGYAGRLGNLLNR
jgi:predicted secreted hydrolase